METYVDSGLLRFQLLVVIVAVSEVMPFRLVYSGRRAYDSKKETLVHVNLKDANGADK